MSTEPTSPEPNDANDDLRPVIDALTSSYRADARGARIGRRLLPSREATVEVLELAFQIFYPGIYGRQDLAEEDLAYHVGNLLATLRAKLARQIELSLCYGAEQEGTAADTESCARHSRKLAGMLVARLPELRAMLVEDVQAAYDGDPAASSVDEIVLAYPGLRAVTVHRVAHELYMMGVPILPRIMSEWAHAETGADIHPGARIGRSFFVDHATGVVVGETSSIGDHVKLYQGVTLGALSHPRDEQGRVIRNTKRHPTVEDGATLYANATVLGGTTVVGEGSIVGGSVFLTKTIPKRSRVALKPPELRVVASDGTGDEEYPMEFEI
jgi:serine O-acetyltransferase